MRGRASFAWALAGGFLLAALLVFATHPVLISGPAAGMSAPAPRSSSIDSGTDGRLLQTVVHGGPVLLSSGCAFALRALGACRDEGRCVPCTAPHYGPLHRRPPPSLS